MPIKPSLLFLASLLLLSLGMSHCVVAAEPVKVFILAGQSNMEGQAVADLDGKDYNDGKGTLEAPAERPGQGPARQAPLERQGRVGGARRCVGPLPARERPAASRAAHARLHASTAASTTSAPSCNSATSSATISPTRCCSSRPPGAARACTRTSARPAPAARSAPTTRR